jgi:hypothetical protein
MGQLAATIMLKARGIPVAASAPMHFVEDTPTAILYTLGARRVAEFEKTTLVGRLATTGKRERLARGEKVEGRKSHFELRPGVVKLAKALARKNPKAGS